MSVTVADLARTDHLLVALDFDGTLAPLVDEPMTARATPAAKAAVAALLDAPATTVAFVSGRSLHDLRVIGEHDDASSIALAGSHGAEFWLPAELAEHDDAAGAATDDEAALRDRLRAEAEALAANVDGAWIEPKAFGFAVHTRTTTDAADAATLGDAVDALVAADAPTWRRRVGHDLREYAFRDVGKDGAVAHLRDLSGATAVVFAGDDVTDEDALRSLGDADLGIRVGGGETAASVRVDDIAGLADLLMTLAHARSASRQ
ncbi:trehalose-phosphatase [Microbacterium dauci]|uniref:Trehalose 6-phosphate phosphatase n=1 Tax=Microbacterium dauci TaxID=3048008 RepID=A0ABT6ZBN6_9MICO|nr:trehalose-phosphatase [Microbacterium sp. LX3-4]MDJ1113568.1 trehalose-phosphatase [Microbacterium sp. LX3-4]